eukprot:g26662.t1
MPLILDIVCVVARAAVCTYRIFPVHLADMAVKHLGALCKIIARPLNLQIQLVRCHGLWVKEIRSEDMIEVGDVRVCPMLDTGAVDEDILDLSSRVNGPSPHKLHDVLALKGI